MLWQVILLTCCLTSSFHFLLKKNLCFNDILPRCLRYLLFLNQVNVDFFFTYSQTCIKRCPFWTKTSGLIKQVTSQRFFFKRKWKEDVKQQVNNITCHNINHKSLQNIHKHKKKWSEADMDCILDEITYRCLLQYNVKCWCFLQHNVMLTDNYKKKFTIFCFKCCWSLIWANY
jgi:hypothetical protein